MKGILTKKVIVITSIVTFIALTAIVVAFATGNVNYPGLSNPDEVFYQRLDEQGNVIYSITNEELFEEIKSNDGIQQLLFLTDMFLLSEYIKDVQADEVAEKLLELTYGTSDSEILADMTDETKADAEKAFAQTMTLAGFNGKENEYARLMVAREKYALDYSDENGVITETNVLTQYLNSYFGDISAIKIRFTSKADAENVMQRFNLVTLAGIELRAYNGFVYKSEKLVDGNDDIVEAYIPVDVYYFDESNNIVDLEDDIIYSYGANGIYTDEDDAQYRIEAATGNLIDGLQNVVIEDAMMFDTKAEAETYKEANTVYYTVSKVDAFDSEELATVKDSDGVVVYTVDKNEHIWDTENNDVTYDTDLVVNKIYTDIEDVNVVTKNNSTEITTEEALAAYIKMYNYVYSKYRTALPEGSTVEDLLALDNSDLQFNFDDENDKNSAVADYMFGELIAGDDDEAYSKNPVKLQDSDAAYYYMVYKLDQADKIDVMDTIFDYVQPLITIPTTIGSTIELPKTTYYNGTIAWSSSDSSIISSTGVVVNPDEDTEVELTYTITILGKTRSFDVIVTVLADGETVEVTQPEWEEVPLKDILNNQEIYDELYAELLDTYINGSAGATNVDKALMSTRADLGFVIYDRYIGMDYQSLDKTFTLDRKGDKEIICSFEKTLNSETPYEVTADQFFEYTLTNNAALYTLYAAQDKELLYSTFYTEAFGEETDITKNKTDRMDEMYAAITNAKSTYVYYKQIYEQMGSKFGYSTFSDYSYAQYGAKTEFALLQYFVTSTLQPYLIQETVDDLNVIDALYDKVQEYYDNYFSLDVSHVLIHLDFDEDGSADDFNEYKESLTEQELADFNVLVAELETLIDEYQGTFDELVEEYNNASREDEFWGEFKQNGFFIITQDLNYVDEDGKSHSRTYAGENTGVKDQFVQEFVDALVDLYDLYQHPQNLDKDEMFSEIVTTEFGLHLIKVEKGDDFDKPSCKFTEEDAENPKYSDGVENDSDAPSLDQMKLYALYTYYGMVYDLSDSEVENKYGISVPDMPAALKSALDTYFEEILSSIYVLGTININLADRISNGEFVGQGYSDLTDAQLMTMLGDVENVYYEAILGEYFN